MSDYGSVTNNNSGSVSSGSGSGRIYTTETQLLKLQDEVDVVDNLLDENKSNTEIEKFLLKRKEFILNKIDSLQRRNVGSANGSDDNNEYSSYDYNSLTTSTDEQIKKLQAEVALLKSLIAGQDGDEDLEEYLSDRERSLLKKMDTMSNKITQQSEFVKDIMNKPVMDIIHSWSAAHQDILRDTADLVTKSNPMENIKNTNKWWLPIGDFLREFINILTGEERMFYVGLTIIFIGLIFVFINVTN